MRAAVDDHELDRPAAIGVGVALGLDQGLYDLLKLRDVLVGDLGPAAPPLPMCPLIM
jgi:hypothetical protein